MKKGKNLGIWMDHSSAHVMEYTTDDIQTKIIEADSSPLQSKGEESIHNKEQKSTNEYYKMIAEEIKNYDNVLIFGPTNAKAELNNILKGDNHFENINIEMQSSDKMTENQLHAFVRDYFSKN